MPKWLRAVWLFIADAFDDLFWFPTSLDRQNDWICAAIKARHPLRFRYRGGERTVEPFCLGVVQPGSRANISLLCYQTGGYAELAAEEGWKLYRAREISQLAEGREPFPGDRPGYDPDRIPMYKVYCRVIPSRRWAGPAAQSVDELLHGPEDEAARERVQVSHDELMHLFRRMHPEAVPDLDDVEELPETSPENEEPAPRSVTPAPERHPGEPSGD